MVERFVHEIARYRLCDQQSKILLAVSGGVDSMVLLHLFHKAGYPIAVAHCNFRLRGGESDEDEKFVEEQCKHYNVPFYSRQFNTNNYAAETGMSLQMAARELRYEWFNELAAEVGYSKIATAHHLNDNLETTLLNLVRGSGIDGIKGMAYSRGNVIRPLLEFTREEITRYAEENQISWREDSSNVTDDYDRNFVRHQIIPKLKEINPSLEQGFQSTSQRLRGAHELAQMALNDLAGKFLKVEEDRMTIDKNLLLCSPQPETVVWEFIKHYGFNFSQCKEIVAASDGVSGKKFFSPGYRLIIDREMWIINKLETPLPAVTINSHDTMAKHGSVVMRIEKSPIGDFSLGPLSATVDAGKVSFPLVWRRWKAGDSFFPLGMKGQKKLSDFLIDNKISIVDKDHVTVVESLGNILWVVGHRLDDRFKVTDSTREVIHFRIDPYFA